MLPISAHARARRARAGNTIRKQTKRGTWAPINVGADGERFQRVQLTMKLRPEAREALEQMAAASGLRVCEVLEQLILGEQQQQPEPATATVEPEPEAPAITPDELHQAIYRPCVQHGADWPRGIAQALSVRAGITK